MALASLEDGLVRGTGKARYPVDTDADQDRSLERLRRLELEQRRVAAAFGPGPVSSAAEVAMIAAQRRVRDVSAETSPPRSSPESPEVAERPDSETSLREAAQTFVTAATSAMQSALPANAFRSPPPRLP